ncbi:MAG: AhpC/TSA family protein [FCB group bacterium]|nr:AhpC/TSA family protein [FCB group bacterium]
MRINRSDRLQPGMTAPNFVLRDTTGKLINLQAYSGTRVLLSFYRYASCPFCNLRVHKLIKKYPEYHKAGLEMIAVFESPVETIARYAGRQNPPFPLLADPSLKLYAWYGIQSSWWAYLKSIRKLNLLLDAIFIKGYRLGKMDGDKALVPADFLISEDGTVHTAYYGRDIGDHLPLEAVEEFLVSTAPHL